VTDVAVVGLGAMGSRIARRLLDSGNDVVVWNRDAAKAGPLVEAGAVGAATPADAARRAGAVIVMVSDPEALRAVTEGPEGLAAGATADTTVIQMSTVGPEPVLRLASQLPDGVGLLDAPGLGSLSEVESGTLKVFVGGPPELVERWTPLLSTLGTVLHVGPVGAGSAAKLVANATLVGTIGLLGETVALADHLGISRDVTFEVLAATPLAAQAERRRQAIETGEYPTRFALSLARKDADLVLEAGPERLRMLRTAREWLDEAERSGHGEEDYSAVLAEIIR
jgi:3-hydroxyisobutyrate dehydrogenase/2-hydroxy-3-oxopropionate reductase